MIKWIADGMSETEALDYLQKFGQRPDVEYLPYIDKLANEAYQNVLADKQNLLPKKMYEIMEKLPFLKKAFIGTAVDWEFKMLLRTSPNIPQGTYTITGQFKPGADLYFGQNIDINSPDSYWIDITTKLQAETHFNHYAGNGYVTYYR